MDVVELLSFKPTPTPKRPNEDDLEDSDDESIKSSKIRRTIKTDKSKTNQNKTFPKEPALSDKEKEDILKFVENEITEGEVLDDTAVKKLVLNFEKKVLKNREMRIKFPDQPEKFLDSEVDLYEALQDLSAVATVPDQRVLKS
ncbi:unnamed protein product [Leptidea sinapis]|uniref:Beta-catenin-like protein 1 N-terminal domain-containing protein n=1 Tax=Leptidea sinapis TaxID=189913 RepID=A0A5E4QDT2_9NEOP|nr:unnamed protein product [Leptidea sinapis]